MFGWEVKIIINNYSNNPVFFEALFKMVNELFIDPLVKLQYNYDSLSGYKYLSVIWYLLYQGFVMAVSKTTAAKRISVEFEGEQETFLMSILAQNGIVFYVSTPRKRSKNSQFLDIVYVDVEGQIYDFGLLVNALIQAENKEIGANEKNYQKYVKRNITSATNNILIMMVQSLGWSAQFKNSRDAERTLKMNRLDYLCNGNQIINSTAIAELGSQLNHQLKDQFCDLKRETVVMVNQYCVPLEINMPQQSLLPIHMLFQQIISDSVSYTVVGSCINCQTDEERVDEEGLPPMTAAPRVGYYELTEGFNGVNYSTVE